MSVRAKYKHSAIAGEIKLFDSLIEAHQFDEALQFWREHLEKPTLFGLETSLKRAALLQRFFPHGLDKLLSLTKDDDKMFVLYSLALTLNLTSGYPNRAIPLYEKHDALGEKTGDFQSLSASFGHHAKALRQVGRFRESEAVASKGLQIIRERRDFLREAVNLYWLGMGLAHRGEAESSEIALQRALRIFRAKFAVQAEGVVNAFLAQRNLWLGFYEDALTCAERAEEIGQALEKDENHADLHGAVKILTAAARMKGEALIFLTETKRGEKKLLYALQRAREIEFTEEELPALRALALRAKRNGDFAAAREFLRQTWHLAERGGFALYNADSYNILANIEAAENNPKNAIEAAQKAFRLAWCDGVPFAYRRGLEDASELLIRLNAEIPTLPPFNETKFLPMPEIEINPNDEFA